MGEKFTEKQMKAIGDLQKEITGRLQRRAAKQPQGVLFQQGVYDALMHEIPFAIAKLAMELVIEVGKLQREVKELKTRDARRLEIIKEAVDRAKGRTIGQADDATNSDSAEAVAEHGGGEAA